MSNRFITILMFFIVGVCCFGLGAGAGGIAAYLFLSDTDGYSAQTVYVVPSAITEEPEPFETETPEEVISYEPSFVVSSALSGTVADAVSVVKGTAHSVVSINVVQTITQNFGYWQIPRVTNSAGSGVIIAENDEKIFILTNNHVIDRATDVTISIDDTKTAKANFVGANAQFDLAVISVTKANLKAAGITEYSIAEFGDSDKLEVGERVVAIGNAYGEGKSATQGIVSALHKQITTNDGSVLDVLQTDAAINPGNSGGALVNAQSQVIGINTAKLSSFGVEGMGYSIPSNTARKIADDIMKGTAKKEATFGVISGVSVNEATRAQNSLPATGVYVRQVARESAAAEAGIRAGDLISVFNGVKLTGIESLNNAIANTAPGDVVEVVIYRNSDTPQTVKATMKERPQTTNF